MPLLICFCWFSLITCHFFHFSFHYYFSLILFRYLMLPFSFWWLRFSFHFFRWFSIARFRCHWFAFDSWYGFHYFAFADAAIFFGCALFCLHYLLPLWAASLRQSFLSFSRLFRFRWYSSLLFISPAIAFFAIFAAMLRWYFFFHDFRLR